MKLLSIVIPIYNSASFLKECLDSVINQTYNQIEIILVDDGSTDESGTICDNYAKEDKHIRVVHKQNEGHSKARNTGIDIASGDYILFVDSDDSLFDNNAIAVMMNNANNYQADIVVGSLTTTKDIQIDNIKSGINIYGKTGKETLLNLLSMKRFSPICCNSLFKRSLFEIHNLRYCPLIMDDEELIPKLYYLAASIIFIENITYFYRLHANSVTHNVSERSMYQKGMDYITTAEHLVDFFKDSSSKMKRHIYERSFGFYCAAIYVYSGKIKNKEYKSDLLKQLKKNNYIFNEILNTSNPKYYMIYIGGLNIAIFLNKLSIKLFNRK